MTENCFYQNFRRLKGVYGEDAFPPEREKIILVKLRRLTDDEFSEVCDTLIGECRYAPTLKEFEKAAKGFLDNAYKREEQAWNQNLKHRRDNKLTCRLCDDSGHVSAIHKENPSAATFSFRCPEPECVASQKYARTITPVWCDAYEEKFALVEGNKTPHQCWERVHASYLKVVEPPNKVLSFGGLTHVSKIGLARVNDNDGDGPEAS